MYRIGVVNVDQSYIDGPDVLLSSMNNFTYQPLIPGANLSITLTAVFIRGISGNLIVNTAVTTTGDGMQICN